MDSIIITRIVIGLVVFFVLAGFAALRGPGGLNAFLARSARLWVIRGVVGLVAFVVISVYVHHQIGSY